MDLNKLEKISGLKIQDNNKDYIQKSLKGVFQMMDELNNLSSVQNDNLMLKNNMNNIKENTVNDKNFININNENYGINMEDGKFLAPKVIKKD